MTAKKRRRTKARRRPVNRSIPAGYRTVTPYIVMDGASRAIEFYKGAFGAKELNRTPLPDGKLMHAAIKIGDSIVMLSDEFPGSDTKAPSSLGTTTTNIHLYTRDADKLWQQAVAAGAKVLMPLEDQFWGERYGKLADPFGHIWSVSMVVPMSKAERARKQQEAMAMFEKGAKSGGENWP